MHAARDADVVILALANARQDQQQAELLEKLVETGRRVIGVAVAQPYDALAFPALRTALATYEYTRPALAAAVQVLFGEMAPHGRLPVSLAESV